jgi:hypothetical protein
MRSMQFESLMKTDVNALDQEGKYIVPIYERSGLLSLGTFIK